MEISQTADQQPNNYLYQYAANLLANSNKSGAEVERLLMLKGMAADEANAVVRELENPIQDAKKAQAKKDMLHGGLWCIGGLALTLADVGFVFWGAILFGGIQFIKGVTNLK
jgi:fructosamine-3-kinase